MKSLQSPNFQSSHPDQEWWKLLWRLSIPPKVRLFLWKASNDFLRTEAKLFSKHITNYGICPLYKIFVGTTSRSLIFAQKLNMLEEVDILVHLNKLREANFLDVVWLLRK